MPEYTAKDVRVLGEIEHIKLNAGMYIGNTENPVHLIEEAIDNALDEVLAGHATIVAVNLDLDNHIYTVLDNGRGLPISDNIPEIVSTKLFSGAKFQDSKTAYEISSGLHGVGLVAVNALSDFYIIEVYRNGQHAKFEFKNTKLKNKIIEDFVGDVPFSTKIQFKPTKKVFEKLEPDVDRLRKRLTTAAAELPGNTFVLNVNNKDEKFQLTLDKYFLQHCVGSDEDSSKLIKLESFQKPESFNVTMSYVSNGTVAPRVFSSVNLLPVDSGGTHVNYFLEILRDFFSLKAKKLDYKFLPQDCFYGLRVYLSLNIKAPNFSGQTKDKLTNRKTDFDKLIKQLKTGLETYFDLNPDYLETLLSQFENYRQKINAKKLDSKTGIKRASTKFTKLRDCTSRNGELFIVEGDSAAGGLIQCRDPRTVAILPLKGKIPNISGAKDILKNKEIGELIQAIGTGVVPHFDISKIRYDKIICATDADPDGAHIASLLTMVMAILVPDIIKQGKYFIAQTPLFAINEPKMFIPLWEQKEIEKAIEKNRTISRFKGLGELSPSQLKTCLVDHQTRKLIPITFSKKLDKIVQLFSVSDVKRKLLEGELYE